jgi:5-methylcytosine-specific restriction endonuclease McrA
MSDGYPPNWNEIATAVKDAAGWCCEHCHAKHDPTTGYTLTVHHLNGIKSDCSPANLVALCQRCHLRIQQQYHPLQMFLFEPPAWAKQREL